MPYEFKINALKFRAADGEDVSIVPKKIVVFVGPNNAGKSTALKEIRRAVLNEDDYYGNVYSNSDAESHSSNCIFFIDRFAESKIGRGGYFESRS